ncbi:MAG: hypothetical protein RLN86_09915 [Cyclobacteriaceae bacterium]
MNMLSWLFITVVVNFSAQELRTGTYTSNGRTYSAIMIDYQGDIGPFVNNMKKLLGRDYKRPAGAIGYILEFRNASVPDWSDKRLQADIWIQSRNDNHIITFSCREKNGRDCVGASSPSRHKIGDLLRKSFIKID